MSILHRSIARIRAVLRGSEDPGFDAEIHEHLTLLAQRYVRQGMTPADAARAARLQFGNTTRLQEDRRDMQTIPTLESLWIDVRQALRAFRKQPTFAAAVVLTLALGIGANTAIFSICNAVLLAPLPYADAGRIVMLWELMGTTPIPVSPANFVDWRRQSRSFDAMAAINPFSSFVLTGSGEPVRLSAAAVSWDFFSVLGTRPAPGRGFLLEEDQPGRHHVVIVSHGLWVERFGRRPDILGASITLNDVSYTVVGVLPPEFELVAKASDFQTRTRFDVWVPLALSAAPSRGSHPLRVFARLKPDVTLEQAQAEVAAIGAQLAAAYPEENKGKGIGAVPLRQQATADVRRVLLTLLAAVGFVLAIACANVANLMLTRSAARQRETALRLAIGASRRRIAQQLLIESTLLGLLGGAIGLVLAGVTLRAVGTYLPADLSRAAGVAIDWPVMLFTAVVSLATGILFGLAPLIQSRRLSARVALEHGTRVAGASHSGLRHLLVIVQVAVVLTLLVGAGLMSRSLWSLLQVPLGIRSDHVLTARITLPRTRYADVARVSAFQRELLDRLRSAPGVQSAGATAYLPLSGDDNGWAIFIEGRPSRGVGVYDFAAYRVVSDGYFETLGMPLLQGRTFTAADNEDAPLVIVINEAMARAYWGDRSPLGRRLRFGGTPLRTVVGVVGDIRHQGPARGPQWEMYLPFGQARNVETAPSLVVRTAIDAAAMTPTVRAAVSAIDPLVPLDRIQTLEQLVAASTGEPRFRTFVLAALSLLALAMAAIGIYGVTSYAVVQRTREIGIALAVGASSGAILRQVLGRAALLIVAGLGVGLVAAVGLTRLISGLLFGVTPLDFPTFAGVSLLLFAVACLASYLPARRATRIDPMVALRDE
jgi:putative ABC transport system permease protein